MSTPKQYVCHISGQGEKWEVIEQKRVDYIVRGDNTYHYLPKSEYRLCEPPERWNSVEDESFLHLDYVFTRDGQMVTGQYRVPLKNMEKLVSE